MLSFNQCISLPQLPHNTSISILGHKVLVMPTLIITNQYLDDFLFVAVDSKWSVWTQWTVCTVSCGGGYKHRERECVARHENITMLTCPGDDLQNVSCAFAECPGTFP